jgi:HesB-like selenoprotein
VFNDNNYQQEAYIMDKLVMSNEAYEEFKAFLDENNIEKYSIRINLAGSGCSGPSFHITADEAQEGDIVQEINDITFLINQEIFDEYGIFTILSSEENDGMGLSLRPIMEPVGGCGGCSGCH